MSGTERDRSPHALRTALLFALALSPAACGGKDEQKGPMAIPVKAMTVIQRDTPLYHEFVGEVKGSREVDLRARISGVLVGKHFQDGALVKEGELLFTIDPREALADQASARANLAAARADLARARQEVARYEPLVRENAISRQIYDNSVAAAKAAQAQVDANQAMVEQASLGVEYSRVTAPLTGRIGAANVFVGDLINAGTTTLAQLSEDDPAWVYFSISEDQLLYYERRFRERAQSGADAVRHVRLSLSDGSDYPQGGQINFADRALDPRTGTYRLRAEFPNHDHLLRPGLFARIRVTAEKEPNAIVVPDRAVVQMLGKYFVIVVGADGKAEQRAVSPGARQSGMWVIERGLKAGETIVVEGVQKARPGTPVKVTKVTLEQLLSPPAPQQPDAPPGGAMD